MVRARGLRGTVAQNYEVAGCDAGPARLTLVEARSPTPEGGIVMAKSKSGTATISADEQKQVERANKSGKTPVAFVHGLWLLPNSWDNWVKLFEKAGYVAVTPGWP